MVFCYTRSFYTKKTPLLVYKKRALPILIAIVLKQLFFLAFILGLPITIVHWRCVEQIWGDKTDN